MPVFLISHNMPDMLQAGDRIHIHRFGGRAALVNPDSVSMEDAVTVMTKAKPAATLDQVPGSVTTTREGVESITSTENGGVPT